LILRNITDIVATRSQDFTAKNAPNSISAGFKGPTSKEKGGEGRKEQSSHCTGKFL